MPPRERRASANRMERFNDSDPGTIRPTGLWSTFRVKILMIESQSGYNFRVCYLHWEGLDNGEGHTRAGLSYKDLRMKIRDDGMLKQDASVLVHSYIGLCLADTARHFGIVCICPRC